MKEHELKSYKEILISKQAELLGIAEDTLTRMGKGKDSFPDPLDRALSESSSSIELRKRDRERKLIQKITTALKKIDEGTYGICESCDEYISHERLSVWPEATLCIECKEEQEKNEKQFES